MSRESALFYVWALGLAIVGTVIAELLGWGDTAVFVAGMGPLAVVMLIFMKREDAQRERGQSGSKRTQAAGGTRAG